MFVKYCARFRELALRILEREGSYRKAAMVLDISSSTLHRWKNAQQPQLQKTKKSRQSRWPLSQVHLASLREALLANPVTTLEKLRAVMSAKHGFRFGKRRIRRLLKEGLAWSRKRTSKQMAPAHRLPGPTAVQPFCQQVLQAAKSGSLIVSIDECYFSEKVLPLYGYAPVGQRCVVRSPCASWQKRSLILAVTSDGMHHHVLLRGSVNSTSFRSFIASLPFPRGAVLLLDNVAFHQCSAVRQAMADKGYTALYTPAYSPQFNPVEMVFAKVKHDFRMKWPWVAEGGVDQSVRCSIESSITRAEVQSCFRHVRELCARSA